jgi:hypothetical protein
MADPTVVLSGAHRKKKREGGGAREGEERGLVAARVSGGVKGIRRGGRWAPRWWRMT